MQESDARCFSKALITLSCIFPSEVAGTLCENTKKCAAVHILERPTYARHDGSRGEVTPLEMLDFIGMTMGPVEVLWLLPLHRNEHLAWLVVHHICLILSQLGLA